MMISFWKTALTSANTVVKRILGEHIKRFTWPLSTSLLWSGKTTQEYCKCIFCPLVAIRYTLPMCYVACSSFSIPRRQNYETFCKHGAPNSWYFYNSFINQKCEKQHNWTTLLAKFIPKTQYHMKKYKYTYLYI